MSKHFDNKNYTNLANQVAILNHRTDKLHEDCEQLKSTLGGICHSKEISHSEKFPTSIESTEYTRENIRLPLKYIKYFPISEKIRIVVSIFFCTLGILLFYYLNNDVFITVSLFFIIISYITIYSIYRLRKNYLTKSSESESFL